MSQVTDINTQLSDADNENEDEFFAFVSENVQQSIQNDKKTKFLLAIETQFLGSGKLD